MSMKQDTFYRIRSLSKRASNKKVARSKVLQDLSVHLVDNDLSTVTPTQVFTKIDFQKGSIELLSAILVGVSLIYTQIYLTCLPSIASHFSAPHFLVQWAFTGNLLCFGLSQLFYGPLSDYYGRKNCLLFGLWLALVGNSICLLASNIAMLFFGQLMVGLGSGACSVIPRVLSRDILPDSRLIKAIASMSIASTIATAIAPILGGFLQKCFGWQSVFLCLVGITIVILLLVTFFITETIKIGNAPIAARKIIANYGKLFLNNSFLVYVIINSCAYSVIIIYLILSPFLFQNLLHNSISQNSFIYLFCAVGYLMGNIFVHKNSEKLAIAKLIWLGIIAIIMGSIFIVMAMSVTKISVNELFLAGLLIHFGSGVVTPITYKKILCIPEFSAGISSGAINAIRVLLAFVLSICTTLFTT